jgi:Tfp pilus assembly protein PilX
MCSSHPRNHLSLPPQVASVRACEQGSAYIIALLILVVLSIVGIGLTLITQTEVQIGAAEANQNKSFYAADSWNAVVDPYLYTNATTNTTFTMNNTTTGNATFMDSVTVTPFTTTNVQNCNICDISQNQSYKELTNNLNSTANHNGVVTSPSTQEIPFSQKTIGVFIVLQPFLPSVFHDQSNTPTNDILTMKF